MMAVTRVLAAALLLAACGRQVLSVAPQQSGAPHSAPPSVRLAAREPGRLYRGFTAYFVAEAHDRDGVVRKVEFRAGDVVFGTDDSSPYEAVLQPAALGALPITVTAIDDDDLRSLPHTVMFDVVECPPTEVCESELPVSDSCCMPPTDAERP